MLWLPREYLARSGLHRPPPHRLLGEDDKQGRERNLGMLRHNGERDDGRKKELLVHRVFGEHTLEEDKGITLIGNIE
jgi:hypothetical protein